MKWVFSKFAIKMKSKLVILASILVGLISCFKQEISISALAEAGQEGSYIIKWEVYPELEDAMVEIYASDNDSIFPPLPIRTTNVNQFIAVIEHADSLSYKYFRLKVGNTLSEPITNRFYTLDDIQNFRDIGGYKTNDGKTIKWGKIFRSGEFSQASEKDKEKLKRLNIKSVIDLRPEAVQIKRKDVIDFPNRHEIYISGISNDSITEQVLQDRFLRGDAIIYMQDAYEEMLVKYSDEFANLFDYLTNPENYPVVYHCSLGKDQSGVATYFLLKALNVPNETIETDYRYSNRGINKSKIIKDVSSLSEAQQQTFTMLTRTDISYLLYGLGHVRKENNSIDEFMTNKLKLTKEKRAKLREILLY